MASEERKFDVRTIERYLREGVVSRDEYEEHLEELPDVSDKAEDVEAEFVEGVLDEEEEPDAQEEEEADDEETEES